mmetsp:Transcript_23604/g.38192  ORF Transcript_23604/g.38192 Transcript_23604/m.38192 type:complete len:104 (+) Transcript_23604:796-1107(+)
MPPLASSSLWGPISFTCPPEITAMRSQFCTVVRRWATTRVVKAEAAWMRSSASCTTRSLSLSRALVASSSSRILGALIRARAMAMRCFCPPLSWTPASPTSVS